MLEKHSISIIICTYNRTSILKKCLASVSEVIKKYKNIEILLINNNNIQETSEEVRHIYSVFSNIRSIDLLETGLSLARNLGVKEAKSEWLIYLDDDVKIDEIFLPKAIEIINTNQFDCFGGMYYPWYPEGKPEWLSTDFGEKKPLRADTGAIQLLEDGFLSAGIMAVKKEAIEKVGGFRVDLGMNDGIGYGEEDDFQLRLQVAGYRLGFVHDWYMHHAVLAHKYKVYWHLKSAYARGRDAQRIHKTYSKSIIRFKLVQVIITAFVKRAPLAIIQLFFKNKFYWQNAVLYTFEPIYNWLGKWKGVKSG